MSLVSTQHNPAAAHNSKGDGRGTVCITLKVAPTTAWLLSNARDAVFSQRRNGLVPAESTQQ